MTKRVVRAEGNYDADRVSEETGLHCKDESRAVQSQRDEADINVIVRRFGVTGQLPLVQHRAPLDLDFVDIFDYQSAQNAIIAADKAFMALPAEVRNSFENDAGRFVDYASDPQNVEQMRKWGLAVPTVEVTESKVSVAGDPGTVAPAGAGVT